MGKVMRLLITGAGGYLGQATMTAALARGHRVRALLRSPARASLPDGAELLRCDLGAPGPELARALSGVDAVLHLAASLTGDEARHGRDTLAATRALYGALPAGMPVVLAGSMSVYAGVAGVIDETSPLEPDPEARDAYTRAKLAQEAICAGFSAPTTILRIGALVGEGRGWNAHIGLRAGPLTLRLAGAGELPLVHVRDAARALVLAAEQPPAVGLQVFNILGDALPDARRYLAATATGPVLALPWQALMPIARLARALRLPVPGLLRPAVLRYRFAPRRYPNARARQALGWAPECGVMP